MDTDLDNTEPLLEPPYPEAAARIFADALYRLLPEGYGVICRGLDEDGHRRKYGVWKAEGNVKMIETRNPDLLEGAVFKISDSEEEAITKAVFDSGIVMEL
jgi:hypothetical protein